MKGRFSKIFLSAVTALSVFGTLTYTSCSPDKCKGINCAYGGTCDEEEGSCQCLTGYEGPQCETINRERYKGSWTILEKGSTTSETTYGILIENGEQINQVGIKNLRNILTQRVIGTVAGDTIRIAPQVVNGYTVQGRGYFAPNLYYAQHGYMEFRYTITGPDGVVNSFGSLPGTSSQWHK